MSLLFSDKHRPKNTKQIIGAEYAAMGLLSWMRSWHTPQRQFKAAMISGPPGIGKSILAELACAEGGLHNMLRMDSSRKRTKKALEELEEAFSSRRIDAYLTGKMQRSKPGAVVVDDLDAMITGGADRGGVPQVVAFIKTTKIPVICVCNDANHRSLKTLVAQCMHIRF
jgi:replication factor C subunit 1